MTNVKGNGSEWSFYIETMKSGHILGDHITLYAATKVCLCQTSVSQCCEDNHIMVLGHFAETDNELTKEHYVCSSLSPDVMKCYAVVVTEAS